MSHRERFGSTRKLGFSGTAICCWVKSVLGSSSSLKKPVLCGALDEPPELNLILCNLVLVIVSVKANGIKSGASKRRPTSNDISVTVDSSQRQL